MYVVTVRKCRIPRINKEEGREEEILALFARKRGLEERRITFTLATEVLFVKA